MKLPRAGMLIIGVAVGGLFASGVTYAATASNTIDGCIKPTGVLRIPNAGAACKATEKPLTWNQQGPQGLPGPAGTASQDFKTGWTSFNIPFTGGTWQDLLSIPSQSGFYWVTWSFQAPLFTGDAGDWQCKVHDSDEALLGGDVYPGEGASGGVGDLTIKPGENATLACESTARAGGNPVTTPAMVQFNFSLDIRTVTPTPLP